MSRPLSTRVVENWAFGVMRISSQFIPPAPALFVPLSWHFGTLLPKWASWCSVAAKAGFQVSLNLRWQASKGINTGRTSDAAKSPNHFEALKALFQFLDSQKLLVIHRFSHAWHRRMPVSWWLVPWRATTTPWAGVGSTPLQTLRMPDVGGAVNPLFSTLSDWGQTLGVWIKDYQKEI